MRRYLVAQAMKSRKDPGAGRLCGSTRLHSGTYFPVKQVCKPSCARLYPSTWDTCYRIADQDSGLSHYEACVNTPVSPPIHLPDDYTPMAPSPTLTLVLASADECFDRVTFLVPILE